MEKKPTMSKVWLIKFFELFELIKFLEFNYYLNINMNDETQVKHLI